MDDHHKETAAERFERYEKAVKRDPAAKRLSEFATSAPAKDISNMKAAGDVFEAEEAERVEVDDADRSKTEDETKRG